MTEYEPSPDPCAYEGDLWRAGAYPGSDPCPNDAEPGSEFCTDHTDS